LEPNLALVGALAHLCSLMVQNELLGGLALFLLEICFVERSDDLGVFVAYMAGVRQFNTLYESFFVRFIEVFVDEEVLRLRVQKAAGAHGLVVPVEAQFVHLSSQIGGPENIRGLLLQGVHLVYFKHALRDLVV